MKRDTAEPAWNLYDGARERAELLAGTVDDLRTILGEVRRMLDDEEDPVGILGYIDESMPRVRG